MKLSRMGENVPVVQAMRATRKATRPEASLRRPSPLRYKAEFWKGKTLKKKGSEALGL